MYWVLLVLLAVSILYVIANRDSLIVEHLDAAAGPMNSNKGPVPAASTDTGAKPSELTAGQKDVCNKLKQARDSDNPLTKATFKATSDQGKIPEYCNSMLNDLSDVSALASKLTDLQQEVEQMKKQAKNQTAQAEAAQASLQAMT
jgi:ubiquitin